jgi:hypothetical protein
MGKTLGEILADAASADDLEFKGPDGNVFKLADLRAFQKATGTETAAAKAAREKAASDANEAATILAALQKAAKEMKTVPERWEDPPKPPAWKDDPLYQPLVPVFDELLAMAKASKEQADAVKKSLDQSQAIYALERMRRQWAEAKVRPTDKQFEQVVGEVLAAKELDEMGLPTLEKYLYRTSEPERIKAATEAAVIAAKADWDKTAKAAAVPKPGKFQVRQKTDAPIKDLSELTSEVVANDPDVMAAMEGTTVQ